MLGKLFGSKKASKKKQELEPLPPNIERSILDSVGLKAIPTMPNSAQRAFTLATNPKAETRDFVELVEADEALGARVMKIANSVYYDRGHGCSSISDAIGTIGLNELRCLLNANALCELFQTRHMLRSYLWANDVGTAVTAKVLAERVLPSRSDEAFLAGLMHDVGKLLLLQRNSINYEKIAHHVKREGNDFCSAEASEYPFDHTEVGQLIASRWNFSPDVTAAIRLHHSPWDEIERSSLAAIVKAADTIAHSLGLGIGNEWGEFRSKCKDAVPEAFEALGVPSTDQEGILKEATRRFEQDYELYQSWGATAK